jgi:phage baseplate assembly protein W
MSQIGFPFQPGPTGGTATVDEDTHIRQLIEQVIFTAPGERVNRPTFGSGVQKLLFGPISDPVVSAAHLSVQGALQHWLGDRVSIQDVTVEAEDSTLTVTVSYRVAARGQAQTAQFSRQL